MMKRMMLACLVAAMAFSGPAQANNKPDKKPCGKACQGHIDGYKWAKKKGIDHPARCGDGSTTGKYFNAGCKKAASEKKN